MSHNHFHLIFFCNLYVQRCAHNEALPGCSHRCNSFKVIVTAWNASLSSVARHAYPRQRVRNQSMKMSPCETQVNLINNIKQNGNMISQINETWLLMQRIYNVQQLEEVQWVKSRKESTVCELPQLTELTGHPLQILGGGIIVALHWKWEPSIG